MTNYRLFPATNGPGAPSAATGGWLLGVIFSVTGGMRWLNGYYHWVPTGGDTVARKFSLWTRYSTTQQSLIANSTVLSGTLSTNQWNFVPLANPIQLAPGVLYVAATGWTAVTGIPVTGGQFGSGNPFSAGIVNGPLTAWSAQSGSNQFPAGTQNYNLGQMLFSNALGNDPSVNMPNNGSGDDNLWMDVQVSDTAPVGYAGSSRMYPGMVDLGNYSLDTANGFTLGKQFSLSVPCNTNNVWFYSPATVSVLPTRVGVYRISDQVLVADNPAPSWSGAAASGWVSTPLNGLLQSGVNYKVVVFQGANVIWNAALANYYSGTGFGANGLVAGPMTVPNNASAISPGQETYNTTTSSMAFPNLNAGPFAYGLDIEITPSFTASSPLIKTVQSVARSAYY